MDTISLRLIRLLLARVPLILSTALLSKLSLSPAADKQDTRTEVVVATIRSLTRIPRPIGFSQKASLRDGGVKGRMWVSTAGWESSAGVRDAVIRAIESLPCQDGSVASGWILPDLYDITGEWTGYRAKADKNTRPPVGSTMGMQYDELMKEVTSPVTILYFHGGAYFLMDPSTHRASVSQLCKRTGGRAFSVRYRLAPQHPFPAALVDALTAYLGLLCPPESSFHHQHPVRAKDIVFAGDSAGGNLAAALCLLLLQLKRIGVTSIHFNGQDVPLELPAGVALTSPWADIGRSLPSIFNNAKYDYLDPPDSATGLNLNPGPADDIWPAKPPRAEIFCQASLLDHPLVSPVVATSDLWEGMPPVLITGGNEVLEDEFTVLARTMAQSSPSASVDFTGYEGMPHCFGMIFPSSPPGDDFFRRTAEFCVQVVTNAADPKSLQSSSSSSSSPSPSPSSTRSKARWMTALSNPIEFREVNPLTMGISLDEVKHLVQKVKTRSLEREQDEVRKWEQSTTKAKL